jgi:class 3 adenylate cyclase
MRPGLLQTAYRRLGAVRYVRWSIVALLQLAFVVVLGGVALLDLYVGLDGGRFVRILAVAWTVTAAETVFAALVAARLVAPAVAWLRGDRSAPATVAAWRALAGLPLAHLRSGRGVPSALAVLAVSAFVVWELDTPVVTTLPAVVAGTAIVLAYNAFVRFFSLELLTRPVLHDVAAGVPDGSDLGRTTVPLRTRLLVALPATNVITAVVVLGVADRGAGIETLGVGVLAAIAVSFTVSLELTLLLLRSVLDPIDDLRRGADRVGEGHLQTRVAMVGSDEIGSLAGSFNRMALGLQERDRLHEALGAFVAPDVAERVLQEGTRLEGEEVEVTVVFVDIRDFTAFAEQAGAPEVVARLRDFYGRVVPVLERNGGHADKFIGDGLLGVFGAPRRLSDHADRGVAAALDIAATVERAYGDRLRVGIGVNSGPVVAGTVGGGGHVEFTVIGDTVNTASRVEAATRTTGDTVLVTGATLALLRRDHGGFVERPAIDLAGKSEPVSLHAPRAGAPRSAVS